MLLNRTVDQFTVAARFTRISLQKSRADGCFNFWGDCLRDLFLWNTIKVKRNCHTCEEYQMFYYDLFVYEAQ